MYLFYATDIPSSIQVGQTFQLDDEQSAHAVRVLRYTAGDTIHIADGRGNLYETCIVNPHPKHCEVEIRSVSPQVKHHRDDVHIAVAPTKNIERMEWMAEKCTEIGVDTITPLLCHYSERKVIRIDRLEKIVLAAAKQSLSAFLPRLNELTSVRDFILAATEDYRFIAHSSPWVDKKDLRTELQKIAEGQEPGTRSPHTYCVLIGPEGGFTDDEVLLAMEHGFVPVSLGEARLRTETAAIVACMMINYV